MGFSDVFDSSLIDYSNDFENADNKYIKMIIKSFFNDLSNELVYGTSDWWFSDTSKTQQLKAWRVVRRYLRNKYMNIRSIDYPYSILKESKIEFIKGLAHELAYDENWDWNCDGGQEFLLKDIVQDGLNIIIENHSEYKNILK